MEALVCVELITIAATSHAVLRRNPLHQNNLLLLLVVLTAAEGLEGPWSWSAVPPSHTFIPRFIPNHL